MSWSTPLVMLVVATVCCGVLAVVLVRTRARRWMASGPVAWVAEGAVAVGVGVWSVLDGRGILAVANEHWTPEGQDFHEFLNYTTYFVRPDLVGEPSWYRYPLYPWLSSRVAIWLDGTPADGAMLVSLAASLALPMCVYALARSLSPAPVAAAGAVIVLRLHPVVWSLGSVTDYPVSAALQCLCLAVAVVALRRGGALRMLALGTALALLMASTPRAFGVLVLLVPAALLRIGFSAVRGSWRKPHRWALALLALWWPLNVCWTQFAGSELRLHTLEHALFVVQSDDARRHHQTPLAVDSTPEWLPSAPPGQQGYWRVGDPGALRGIPNTLEYLTTVESAVPAQVRRESVVEGLAESLLLSDLRWTGLALFACLAAGLPRGLRRLRVVPLLLASGGLTALVVSAVIGLEVVKYQDRYALTVVAMAGALMLAGAAQPFLVACGQARREWMLPWLPLLAFAVFLLGPAPGPLGREGFTEHLIRTRQNSESSTEAMMTSELHLAAGRLVSGDQIVDLTDHRLAASILHRETLDLRFVRPPRGGARGFEVEANPAGRRLLVLPADKGRDTAGSFSLTRWVHTSQHFQVLEGPLVQDMQPAEPLVLGARPSPAAEAPAD